MACNNQPSDCAPCQDCGDAPAPVLPRCQEIAFAPGTYTNATIVVNAAGCVASITSGEPDLYTPDPCCAPIGGGGGGGGGLPGPPGDDGAAATIAVAAVNTGAPGSPASVVNIGTNTAASFVFTIPAGQPGADGTVEGGISYPGPGLVFNGGVLTAVDPAWPPVLIVQTNSAPAGVVLQAVKDPSTGILALSVDLTAYDAQLQTAIDGRFDEQQAQITNLQELITALTGRVGALEVEVQELTDRLDTCCPATP